MSRRPHVLAVPLPAQGHVKPLLKLAYQIADHGIKVTFVNTDFIHAKLIAAKPEMKEEELEAGGVTFVSVPDGLEDDIDRIIVTPHAYETFPKVMPGYLVDLVEKLNRSNNDDPISCIIADAMIGWMLKVAKKVGAEIVGFCPFGPAGIGLVSRIPKLIQEGIMNSNDGSIKENEQICLSKDIPSWRNNDLPWSFPGEEELQEIFFQFCSEIKYVADHVDTLLCNTSYELDSSICEFVPKILPVGPLQKSGDHAKSVNNAPSGSCFVEDSSCLRWLDQQQPGSVVYVAFGSTAIFGQKQFHELALGLEHSRRPFLWVVRSDITFAHFPDGFVQRVANYGKIVEWAPQEKVLAHPSLACFLTHCGWNSIMEGLCAGVPFLCWPYFTDQMHNQSYICDAWKVGLRLNLDENGIRSRHEITAKIESLCSDGDMKANALKLKDLSEKSISKGGSSYENLDKFIHHLKR